MASENFKKGMKSAIRAKRLIDECWEELSGVAAITDYDLDEQQKDRGHGSQTLFSIGTAEYVKIKELVEDRILANSLKINKNVYIQ
ncbi:hypothetical protein GOV08_04550 [Candidatus Woesearchaeota archaeon]|nr:hypothetical protein [Candidatus Woesearchaeota archaeon]